MFYCKYINIEFLKVKFYKYCFKLVKMFYVRLRYIEG